MDEETIGLNMSHRTKTPNNVLVDVEKLGNVVRVGIEYERERILELIKSYWCGEPGCTKHTTNWEHLIENIKGEQK